MPLIQSKSKRALKHNIEAEIHAGKAPKVALGIAYNVKKKPKKMAEGGVISAKSEKRPMPEDLHDDRAETQAPIKKSMPMSKVLDEPDKKQASKGSKPGKMTINPVKGPQMAKSSIMKAILLDKHGQPIHEDMDDENLIEHDAPASDKEQPSKSMDEMGADRQGKAPHKMKMMAKGGMLPEGSEDDMEEHPAGLKSDDDQERPFEEEIMTNHIKMLAEGGMLDDEEAQEHHASIAAAIMAKAKKMAEGGEVNNSDVIGRKESLFDILDNNKEEPNSFYKENEHEALDWDMNDDASKAQPEDSNEHGDSREDDEENEHDRSIVSKIMRKKKQSA